MRQPILMIPGPTNLDRSVLEALALPAIGHTSGEFYDEFGELLALAAGAFMAKKEQMVVITGSGTFGMEAGIATFLGNGKKVLAIVNGFFGERFAQIAEIYGSRVRRLNVADGRSAGEDELAKALSEDDYEAVLMVHSETSNGVLNDVSALARVARERGVYTFVDAVSSLGGVKLDFGSGLYDFVFASSQKCLAAPPGAALIAISDELRSVIRPGAVRSYYFDLGRWVDIMRDPKIYLTTPAIPNFRALRVALKNLANEGVERRWERHSLLGRTAWRFSDDTGIRLLARDRSPTVSAFHVGKGAPAIKERILKYHGILVATGIGGDRDSVIRIGHLGLTDKRLMDETLAAFSEALRSVAGSSP